MFYPVIFSPSSSGYYMYAPDVFGANAFSEGHDIEKALRVMENILSEMLKANHADQCPKPRTILEARAELMEKEDFVMMVQGVKTTGKNVRVTLSMPDYALLAIDEAAKRKGVSRSAYLANLALSSGGNL